VLSPGAENAQRDRVIKLQLYGKYGVPEYWIVDPGQCAVEVYRQQQDSLARVGTFMDQDDITSPLFPDFRLRSFDIFRL
jgi:Uma2 family endonuclease